MNKDEKKKRDDKFKKEIIDALPDFVPDKNKIDIANICSDVVDLLQDKQTNNTVIALEILKGYYKDMFMSRISKDLFGSLEKELSNYLTEDDAKEPSGTIH